MVGTCRKIVRNTFNYIQWTGDNIEEFQYYFPKISFDFKRCENGALNMTENNTWCIYIPKGYFVVYDRLFNGSVVVVSEKDFSSCYEVLK